MTKACEAVARRQDHEARRRGSRIAAAAIAAAILCAAGGAAADPVFDGRWFSADSPFNVRIENPRVTDYSARAMRRFLDQGHNVQLVTNIWGVAVFDTTGTGVPRVDLRFAWPPVHFIMRDVPILPEMLTYADWLNHPTGGNSTRLDYDARTCIYDASKKGFYSLGGVALTPSGDAITVIGGGFSPAAGPGAKTQAGAAGTSFCAGLVLPREIKAGTIDHALAMQWPAALVRPVSWSGSVVYPASHSDGTSTDRDAAIPMGARLQLDPALSDDDLRRLGAVSPGDFAIAHALQVYGGYIVDSTPGNAQIVFQNGFGKGREIYGPLGVGIDGYMMQPPRPGANATLAPGLVPHLRFIEPPAAVPLDDPDRIGVTGVEWIEK